MNYFDIIFIILLAWSAYKGYKQGFIIILSSFVALIIGIWTAIKFTGIITEFVTNQFSISSQFMPLIVFALIFIIVLILIFLLGKFITNIVKESSLGIFNNILGLLINVIKSAFIISLVLVIFNAINKHVEIISKEKTTKSYLYQPLSKFSLFIFPYLKFENLKKNIEIDVNPTATKSQEI